MASLEVEQIPKYGLMATDLVSLTHQVGAYLLELRKYATAIQTADKPDGTIVSEADTEANEIICRHLEKRYPDIPILSEENDRESNIDVAKNAEQFFCVDPLDGSAGYLSGRSFAVLISLIIDNKPTFGIIHDPQINVTYYGGLAIKKVIKIDTERMSQELQPKIPPKILLKNTGLPKGTDTAKYIARYYSDFETTWAFAAIKFGILAESRAAIYPSFGKHFGVWDIAAGDAILSQLGGRVSSPSGQDIDYKNPSLKTGPFIASSPGFIPELID